MLKKQLSYCLLLALAFLNIVCKKDIATPVTPPIKTNPYSITLKVEEFADGPEVTWTAAKSKTFVEYRVLVAYFNEDIPDNPTANSKHIAIVVKKNSTDTLLKLTNNLIFNGNTFTTSYRIQAIFSDSEPVISRRFSYNESQNSIKSIISTIKSDNEEIFALNTAGSVLNIFNTKTKQFNLINLSSSGQSFSVPTLLELNISQNTREALIIQNSFIEVIDLKTRSIVKKILYNNPIGEDIVAGFVNNGKLYISTNQNNIVIIDRNDNDKITKIKGLQSSSFFRYYKIPNENTLLAVEGNSPYTLAVVQLSVNGLDLANIEKKVLSGITDYTEAVINILIDNNTFLIGNRGLLYDRKLNNIGTISSKINSFVSISDACKLGKDFLVINFNIVSAYNNVSLINEKRMYDGSIPVNVTVINNQVWVVGNSSFNNKALFAPLIM